MSNSAKMSARERIEELVDANSFVEIGAMVTKRNTDFNLQEKAVPADGVITGYGVINSSLVYVYSQDVTAMNGSVGEMHAKKIANLYDMAMKVGAPIIGLIDCAGLRLQEATDALAGFGDIYLKQVKASGMIPQITAVLGSCGGGIAISSVLSDFTFIEKNNGKLFVNAPNALDGNYVGKCDTSSADFQGQTNTVDFVCDGENELFSEMRKLLAVLPANNENDAFLDDASDDLNRLVPAFEGEVEDAAAALADISDENLFIEVKAGYAKEMVTGFITLNGVTVGAVANRTAVMDENGKAVEKFDGVLTTKGCEKAERFVKFCDAYNIPLLTLTNVKGYAATIEEEKTIAHASAKLTYAFANADVPKVNVLVGNAFGSAYITMNSKHIGADLVFALPLAKVGMMDAKSAVKIMYDDVNDEKVKEFEELQGSAEAAAKRGYVDTIIEGASVRKQLVYAFEMLYSKREASPNKKHGTV